MAEWVMDRLTGNMMQRGASAAHHVVKGDIDTLTRETGQNCKDQRLPGLDPMKVKYTLIELTGQHKSNFLASMGWSGLKPHIEACTNDAGETGPRLRRGLQAVEADKPLRCLRIEDFGTLGLQGDDFDFTKNFALLSRAEFKTSAVPGRGGSYGLGKAVLWKFSSVATVLLSSLVNGNEQKGVRIFGRTDIPSHKIPGDALYESGGWFGTKKLRQEDNSSFAESTYGEIPLAKSLYLDRDVAKGSGTSVLIIGFYIPDDEEALDLKKIAEEILESACKWFWPSIAGAKPTMSVDVSIEKNGLEVFSRSADPSQEWAPFIRARDAAPTGATAKNPQELAEATVPFKVPARELPKEVAHGPIEPNLNLRVTRGDEVQGNHNCANCVAVFRGADMVVKYASVKRKPLDNIPFFGVLMAGKAAGNADEDHKAEEFFRAAEPPLHDNWEYTEAVKHAYKPGAKQRLSELWSSLQERVFKLIDESVTPQKQGPELLAQMFPFGQAAQLIVGKKSVKTTITAATYLGGKWKVTGEVVRLAKPGQAWIAKIGFVAGTDSGAGEYLNIVNLTTSDKRAKLTADGPPATITAEDAIGKYSFEALLDPPVTLRSKDLDLTAIKLTS
jgi:hypothetical protein